MIMKILSTILLTLLIVLGACTSPQVSPDPFVRVSNGRLTVNGKPYYYIGTNFWYGAILGSQGQGGNRERLLRELDYLKALGINNLRVLVGADGKDGIPTKAEPALQVEAGVYNDTIFDGLDFFLSVNSVQPETNIHSSFLLLLPRFFLSIPLPEESCILRKPAYYLP